MKPNSARLWLCLAVAIISVPAVVLWAAPLKRAVQLHLDAYLQQPRVSRRRLESATEKRTSVISTLPASSNLRLVTGRGLMVNAWVNDRGPYTFAVDTGAGATILSPRVVEEAGVRLEGRRVANLGGLTGAAFVSSQQVSPPTISIGFPDNRLPSRGLVVSTDALPPDLDGVLDPTEAFWPLGYNIDLRNLRVSSFDPRATPVTLATTPPGGAVVRWLPEPGGRRPFVRLNTGDTALLDTGSVFGLALPATRARGMGLDVSYGEGNGSNRDIAGGTISSRRIKPSTIQLGTLELRRIPTDVLFGVESSAPIILGREALHPFSIAFDPINRLVQFTPS